MARRLIVDTGVLIGAERTRASLARAIDPDDDVVMAAITLAELRTGGLLATKTHRARRADYVDRLLAVVPVEPYDIAVAEAHAQLLAAVRRMGRPRGAHDLIIAATAVATGRAVLTTDRAAHYAGLPGVECLEV